MFCAYGNHTFNVRLPDRDSNIAFGLVGRKRGLTDSLARKADEGAA